MQDNISTFMRYIGKSDRIVFFGGAGVSTESGIPDFRSKDGLYNEKGLNSGQYAPEYLLSHDCLINHPETFFSFCRQKLDTRNAMPNITHQALAELERTGKLSSVITQNVDGLHQKAGSKNVIELHGTMNQCFCIKCGKGFPQNYIFDDKESIPRCSCGGIVRPSIILYEEVLSNDAVSKALYEIRNADMLIIGGTSLSVYPAVNLIHEFAGEHLVIINKKELPVTLSEDNDLFIQSSLGDIFRNIDI